MNANELIKKAETFFEDKKFEEIIDLISDEVLESIKEKDKVVELYIRRGTSYYKALVAFDMYFSFYHCL